MKRLVCVVLLLLGLSVLVAAIFAVTLLARTYVWVEVPWLVVACSFALYSFWYASGAMKEWWDDRNITTRKE